MIIVNNVFLPLETDFSDAKRIMSSYLNISYDKIYTAVLRKKSVDARKKDNICFCCSFVLSLETVLENRLIKRKNCSEFIEEKYNWNLKINCKERPVVVGFGPAGMFAALLLARSGLKPIVFERGDSVDKRIEKVNEFFNGGKLDNESNIQFGEGGAGTFSDGKLNTGIKNNRCRAVLEAFAEFGANNDILYDAKPHIGTDILCKIVKNIRNEIISLGGEVHFNSRVENIAYDENGVKSLTVNSNEILVNKVLLCTGHSARDVFLLLKDNNVKMERKPFAMGVRIEHLQKDINKALYGDFAQHKALGAAPYKLAVHLSNGRGVYTFCMCPGGEVINASSEVGGVAVNGMSYNSRSGINANSALLVSVLPEDLQGDDVLEGCYLQRKIEEKAFRIGNGAVPVTTVGNIINGCEAKIGKITPTVKPSYVLADFKDIFPDFIYNSIKASLPLFDKKLNGFADSEAVLTAPETRSSSPVRILRDENCESITVKGMFPCGEGAGYAGGIMSAAVDGLLCAEKLMESIV
ncbi:MAG: hypothetical protein U0M42_04505 [Acutalibacteraceae bacterium]|nr:hypothetical protein [Acutalibacteraceae bacterium]